ncbi:MAG: DUF5675 family protein [Thiomicrospira sp.]|nr:DUF5675 family protein [Thiomicrospira sp.]
MSREWILERFCDCEQMGVFGRLLRDGVQIAYSVEQTWRDNQPFTSCVPSGRYEVVPYESKKYGKTVALKNLALDVGVFKGEAKRYACLIHPANRATELQGCVAFGEKLTMLGRDWAVASSLGITQDIIKQLQPGDTLTIIWKDHP